ncbi:MAG: alpha/beta hydrolase [Lentisphaerae bacterium]|nr:alpha/beta hydrolase [Lentisphaerota bacterium]
MNSRFILRVAVLASVVGGAALAAQAAENPYAAEVAAFGKVVDLWPEGKMPGEATTKAEILDRGKPDGDVNYQNVSHPTITIRRAPGDGVHPAMLICPGGGYFLLAWRHEGMEIAQWANSLGMDAFILKYRVPNDGGVALMDAQRAVSWIRANAKELKVDPTKIAQIGFSAGANLTARTANNFGSRRYDAIDAVDSASSRPDATLLIYPGGLLKGGFRAAPTPDLALNEENIVTKETPPVFITQTEDDFCQVENSLAYYLACKKCGVNAAMLLGPKGGHGYGSRRTGRDNDTWPDVAGTWLKRVLQF